MRLLRRIVTSGGVAAFFFFAWVIMMLWNSIIVGHLELAKPLSYLQTCGLWFMITLFLAWTGIGMGGVRLWWWGERRSEDFGREIENKIKRGFAHWVGTEEDLDWDELGDRIEKKIKARLKEWLAEDTD